MNKITIAIDAMGGDNAPDEIIDGALQAINDFDIKVILVGKQDIIENKLASRKFNQANLEIVNANEVVDNHEQPTSIIKNKKDSSLVVALNLLKERKADGLVSAGSTGALLACSTIMLKRIKGISRPALATPLPNIKGISLLLDSGANVDCKPEYLEQFAKMGSVYMENVMNIKNPKVGLVNVGVEKGKGDLLTKAAYEILEQSQINFVGNIEAREVSSGDVDVIICDGFVGNVILKHTEGLAKDLFKLIKKELMSNFSSKIAALLAKKSFVNIKKKFDYSEIGGAPFLGLTSIVVKAHGSSDAKAIKNAIAQCHQFVQNDITNKIQKIIN